MRGTMPIITCDDENGCDEWEIDDYTIGAMNWRELLAGWQYNPYESGADIFCPKHARHEPEAAK